MSKLSILSARLNKSEESIANYLVRYGISRDKKSVDELETILKSYMKPSVKDIAKKLNKSIGSIRGLLSYYGINIKGKSIDEVINILNEAMNSNKLRIINKNTFAIGNSTIVFNCRYESDIKRIVTKLYWHFQGDKTK